MVRKSGILTILILCAIAGCSKPTPYADTTQVDTLTKEILQAIAEGKASDVYLTHFSEEFRDGQTLDSWTLTTDPIRTGLGKWISLTLRDPEIQHIDGIVVGMFIYDAKWEKGSGVVTVDATAVDNKWTVGKLTVFADALEPTKIQRSLPTSRPVYRLAPPTAPVTP
jgi:hypothetical protein